MTAQSQAHLKIGQYRQYLQCKLAVFPTVYRCLSDSLLLGEGGMGRSASTSSMTLLPKTKAEMSPSKSCILNMQKKLALRNVLIGSFFGRSRIQGLCAYTISSWTRADGFGIGACWDVPPRLSVMNGPMPWQKLAHLDQS